jgi:uncharacterized protein
MRRRVWIIVAGFAALVAAWFADAFWIEPNSLTQTTLDVQDPAWPANTAPLRAVLISDIHVDHLHMPPARVRAIAAQVNALHPDVILLGGDYIGDEGVNQGEARRRQNRSDGAFEIEGMKALDGLSAPLGVYAIMGNHDCDWDCAETRTVLATTHVHLLENQATRLARPGGDVWIEGIKDIQTQQPDFETAAAAVPAGAASLVMTHNPGLFDWNTNHVELQLSGHTHAGQVRFPIIGALARMSRYTEETAKGWTIVNGRILVVTHGLGESGVPLRFGAPPQIMILTIHPGPVAKVVKVSEGPIN